MNPMAETESADRNKIARAEELSHYFRQQAEAHGVMLPDSLIEEYVKERMHTEAEAEERESQLKELARKDPLTGFYNRRMFEEEMETAAAVVRRTGESTCLLAIDIDGFSKINTQYGHEGGDEALKQMAAVLAGRIRPTDRIFRAGEHGDEFMIILPMTDMSGSVLLAERLRDTIEHLDIIFGERRGQTTVGIGISPFDPLLSPQEIAKNADRALYASKSVGKNTIRFMGNDGLLKIPVIEPDPDNPDQKIVRLEPTPTA